MADLSKTGKPSSRSREAAYRALVFKGHRTRLRAALEELGVADPIAGKYAGLKEPSVSPQRLEQLRKG